MIYFNTKQKGYGRQGLYFDFDGNTFYLMDVFPNVNEHFGIKHVNNAFPTDDGGYTDCDGNALNGVYTDLDDWLFSALKDEIGEVLYENLDLQLYEDSTFADFTCEEIAEWAYNK
jgi:hypothetical protein